MGWIRDLAARLLGRRPPAPAPPPPVPPAPPVRFGAGELVITVTCLGSRRAGGREARVVDLVSVEAPAAGMVWTARYGVPAGDHDPRRTALAVLDDLDRAAADPPGWRGEWTAGMSEREAEALLGGPDLAATRAAAAWAAPLLVAARRPGGWRLEPLAAPAEAGGTRPYDDPVPG